MSPESGIRDPGSSAGRRAEAADVVADHPIALQLRNLQILAEIAAGKTSTIVFPAQFLESTRALPRFVAEEGRRPDTARSAVPNAAIASPNEIGTRRPDRPLPQGEKLVDALKGQVWT
ncbi:hypothetical protein [Kitasatospora sp. NPDC087314]|uniref:hypothetical protein n=1 Tax=Kitasatospora sp. NPDC087314 TaxID=3364068 RepID=UPI00381D0CF2